MTWWVAVLIAWLLVGLGVAYLFGGLIRGMQPPESAADQPKRKHGTGHLFPKGRRPIAEPERFT
jgi:hypothetical protein